MGKSRRPANTRSGTCSYIALIYSTFTGSIRNCIAGAISSMVLSDFKIVLLSEKQSARAELVYEYSYMSRKFSKTSLWRTVHPEAENLVAKSCRITGVLIKGHTAIP